MRGKSESTSLYLDNAAEYNSEAMQQIYRTHNILHTTTTPYTPYGDGEVEMGLDSQKGDIKIHHVPTSLNKADILPD